MTNEVRPPKTLTEAIRYFADPDRCLDLFVQLRWPDGVRCPTCGSEAVIFIKTRRIWKCGSDHAKRQFSVKVGTIMEDSPLPLDKWICAAWLIVNCKNGISSYEVHRALGITQKTAWFLLHRLRLAFTNGTFDKMTGTVEADETFIGGLARNMHKDVRAKKIKGTGSMGKVAVLGLLQRHGKKGHSTVRTKVVRDVRRSTLHDEVRQHVEPGTNLMTDEWVSYKGLDPDYTHKVINHAEEYVRGNVHTNGIENFWSLLKRMVRGTYVSVEPFHLFRYLDEQAFRFNERKNEDGDQGRFLRMLDGFFEKRLTYKHLIGQDAALAAT